MPKYLLNSLKLVYPPISNQEAEWLFKIPEVRDHLRASQLYMLAQREEAFFRDYSFDTESLAFLFSIQMGDVEALDLRLDLSPFVKQAEGELELEAGEKHVRVWDCASASKELLFWATTEKLLYDVWRRAYSVGDRLDPRDFTKYRLYYIGISKQQDSFSRLFATGHKNRTKILGNERQLRPTARLTDEIYIFFLTVSQLLINELDIDDDFIFPETIAQERLVADAEKAYIRVLQSKYNTVTYENYPRSQDGLHGQGFQRYGFVIDEDIEFQTPTRSIRGVHGYLAEARSNPDLILIADETVEFIDGGTMQEKRMGPGK